MKLFMLSVVVYLMSRSRQYIPWNRCVRILHCSSLGTVHIRLPLMDFLLLRNLLTFVIQLIGELLNKTVRPRYFANLLLFDGVTYYTCISNPYILERWISCCDVFVNKIPFLTFWTRTYWTPHAIKGETVRFTVCWKRRTSIVIPGRCRCSCPGMCRIWGRGGLCGCCIEIVDQVNHASFTETR